MNRVEPVGEMVANSRFVVSKALLKRELEVGSAFHTYSQSYFTEMALCERWGPLVAHSQGTIFYKFLLNLLIINVKIRCLYANYIDEF